MAIGGFSINISANKPVTKMQCEIKDIQMTFGVNQFEFNSRVQIIESDIISEFQ